MHDSLYAFIQKAEKLALEKNVPLFTISDNMPFDIGNVNELIERCQGARARLPMSTISPDDYRFSMYLDLGCMQRAILLFTDPDYVFEGKWGTTEAVHRLSGLPDCPVVADHNPVNDAIAQLYEFLDILEVRKRYALTLRPELEE